MDCEQTQEFLHGYLDGELDLIRSLEIESHMETCASCAAAHSANLSVREGIRSPGQYFRAPASLESRVRAALEQSYRTAAPEPVRPRRSGRPLRWLAVAAAIAVVFVGLRQFGPRLMSRTDGTLEAEIFASHMRSLMPGHLTDVVSADGHTVKPWFAGRLDFSPRVVDLAGSGFPLAGGRLDYIAGRPAAALVYHRRQHIINLFVWPSGGESAIRSSSRRGYNSVQWTRAGMHYWAISDLNEAELKQFAQLANGG